MTTAPTTSPRPVRRPARAFTLVEAVIAALIVGLVLVGALHAVGASGADQARAAQRARAGFLAQSLLDEVCSRGYSASSGSKGSISVLVTGTLGQIADELDAGLGGTTDSGASRSTFTTVDAYNGLVDSPLHEPDGAVIPGFAGWSREVKVQWVSSGDGWTDWDTDAGAKRVTVTVKRAGAVLDSRSALVVDAP